MDAIAAAIETAAVTDRAYAWPSEEINPPCAVVGYPSDIDFDLTFGRGADTATIPVYFVVGRIVERSARDKLSTIIAGATGIKDVLDGNLGGTVDTARVTDCKPMPITVGGIDYLSAKFEVEVIT